MRSDPLECQEQGPDNFGAGDRQGKRYLSIASRMDNSFRMQAARAAVPVKGGHAHQGGVRLRSRVPSSGR